MTNLRCLRCGVVDFDDVRLVEHGTDDMALCKSCFTTIRRAAREGNAVNPRKFHPGVEQAWERDG